jgi:hypothetical protein
MRNVYVDYNPRDNGGRRSGIERRRFSYAEHIPERRTGQDRRENGDRRSGMDRRCGEDRRSGVERRAGGGDVISCEERRKEPSRRTVQDRRSFLYC